MIYVGSCGKGKINSLETTQDFSVLYIKIKEKTKVYV